MRGHEGVLELFPARTPEGSRHAEQVIALTWIELPGVYIQVVAANLTARQLLETADSLREQEQ